MRVVLPAPLAPTRPNTDPRGTSRLTPSRASLGPNRRLRRFTVITDSNMGSGLLGQGLVAAADEVDQLVGLEAELAGLGQQGVDAVGQNADPLLAGERGAGGGDEGPRRPALDDHTGDF